MLRFDEFGNAIIVSASRDKVLATMAALSQRAGELRAAEGYMLELLGYVAFAGEYKQETAS